MNVYNNGTIIYKLQVKDGKYYKSEILLNNNNDSEYSKVYPCNFSGNLHCVEDRIVAMNVVDYSFCLASAPYCYAQLWSSCIYDNCK